MAAVPQPDPGEDPWDDEEAWSAWDELALLEREERRQGWLRLLGRFLTIALVLPVVVGLLVALLILIF